MESKEVTNYIKSKNLVPIELENNELTSVKILKSNSLDELLSHAQDCGIKRVYFAYMTYDPRSFKVNINPNGLSEKGKEKIELYNRYVDTIDFTKPYKVTIFIAIDSILLGVKMIDNWIQNEDLTDTHVLLEVVKEEDAEEYYHEVGRKRKELWTTKKDEKEELTEIILADPEFAHQKNMESRYYYFHRLIDREGMEKYGELLEPYGYYLAGNVKMFMDEVWRIYKDRLKEE